MATIGFVGLGNMGGPMAANLAAAGHAVRGFDLDEGARARLEAAGGTAVERADATVEGAEAVVTALPAASHVRSVYLGEEGLIAAASRGTLFVDVSTIDVDAARAVAEAASAAGHLMLDSPMSGGVAGAEAGTLTFMVGGPEDAFARAKPLLRTMGRNVFHAGPSGAGAAAKICNNMMLAIQMIAVAEGFNLAERLGLAPEKLYEISSTATARCWSLNDYCPVPGPAPAAPSNRDYRPGFAASLMLKDLGIAMQAAASSGTHVPMGAQATQIYTLMQLSGMSERDFSAVIKLLRAET
ncbi:MAG: 3-hydroxyisobutyrate dehydrogenase [Paracoccaceae bacterium]